MSARRKLNDDKKLSGDKLNKKRKTVSTNSESPKDMEQLESPTKSKKKRQSIETGGAVAKAVQARRFLSDNARATAASTLPARETGSVRDRLDSGGKRSTSGTRKVAKAVRKKTLSQVARALQGRRKDGDPLEMDDSDLEEDVDDSYVVDTSDDSDSVANESSSEEEEVAMEDDESDTPSQKRADAIFERTNRAIYNGRDELSSDTGHRTAPVAMTPINDASSLLRLDGPIRIRGMSRTESMQNRQKHVADRVRTFVKTEVFRRIKFINSDTMFEQAIKLVMDCENVPDQQRRQFQMLYESVFNEALNTKRSSCG